MGQGRRPRAGPGLVMALAAAALLAGCAASPPPRLHFGMEDAPQGRRILFPPEPEVPRFMYAGQLTGEDNFRKEKESGAITVLRWIAGIFAGDAIPTVLQRPQAGATDARGRIFVSDASRAAVFVFDTVGGELNIWEYAEGLKRFRSPVGVAPGPEETLFVADADLGMVARLDAQGNPLQAWGKGLLSRPTGLAYDALRRELFIVDTYAHDIKVLDAEGRLVRTLGARGEESGRFNFPTHVALRKDHLYVADTMNARVVVLEAESGNVLRELGSRGLAVGNLVRPKGVTLDSEGNIYVVESYYDHLLVFDQVGQFLLPIGGVGEDVGKFYLPAGAWSDANDRIYVADMFNGRVIVFQFLGSEGESQE